MVLKAKGFNCNQVVKLVSARIPESTVYGLIDGQVKASFFFPSVYSTFQIIPVYSVSELKTGQVIDPGENGRIWVSGGAPCKKSV